MSEITKTITFTAGLTPTDTLDTFYIQDEQWGLGGYRSVADETERIAITTERRKEGMLVKQIDTGITYTLSSGITDSDWVEVDFSGDTIYTADGTITDESRIVTLSMSDSTTDYYNISFTTIDQDGDNSLLRLSYDEALFAVTDITSGNSTAMILGPGYGYLAGYNGANMQIACIDTADPTDYTTTGNMVVNDDSVHISTSQFDTDTALITATTGIHITETSGIEVFDEISSIGLYYAADYSANYNNRTLVDKEYVDNEISSVAFSSLASQVLSTTALKATDSELGISLDNITIDNSGSDYTISTASNNIVFDDADGSQVYEVTMSGRYDIAGAATNGSTRSYAITRAISEGSTTIAGSEMWSYIREYQGGSNGIPNSGFSNTFLVQPANKDVMTFTLQAVTETGTVTNFELVDVTIVIKRVV